MPTYILCKKNIMGWNIFWRSIILVMQKVIFNEIDDIHSIETTIDIRLSLNFTQFWTSDCFYITMLCTKHVNIKTIRCHIWRNNGSISLELTYTKIQSIVSFSRERKGKLSSELCKVILLRGEAIVFGRMYFG